MTVLRRQCVSGQEGSIVKCYLKRLWILAAVFLLLGSGCALAADVRPVDIDPAKLDLNNGQYYLKLKDLDRIAEEGWFTAALYVHPLYPAEQIRALAPGDTFRADGMKYTVEDAYLCGPEGPEDLTYYEVVSSGPAAGYTFVPEGTDTYSLIIDDWHTVEPVGEVRITLPLPEDFSYTEYEDSGENLPKGAQEFLYNITSWGDEFLPYNTSCTMKDGKLSSIYRYSYPLGPEEDEPADPQPAPNGGYAWEEPEDDGWPVVIQNLYGLEEDDDSLQDASVACFRKDAEGSLVPDGREQYLAGFYRGLAMHGSVLGKVTDPPAVGESLVCVFQDPDGKELMRMELWNGYVAAPDGLYVYCP